MTFVERAWTAPDGLRLSARDYAGADGPARLPVLMIHGLTRNARDFEEVAPAVAAAGRRVLAVDVRGRGRSAWSPDPASYTPAVYAGDVEALMVAAGIARAVCVGTSMGGLITMTLAAWKPERVAAAVLNDVGPVVGARGLERILGYAGGTAPVESWADAAAYAARINGPAFPDHGPADWDVFARRLFREGEGGRPELDYDPGVGAAFAAIPVGPAPDLWPVWDALAAEGRPLLSVRGALSDILEPATVAEMARRAPQLRRVDVPGVGHAPALTEPAAREAMAALLAEVD